MRRGVFLASFSSLGRLLHVSSSGFPSFVARGDLAQHASFASDAGHCAEQLQISSQGSFWLNDRGLATGGRSPPGACNQNDHPRFTDDDRGRRRWVEGVRQWVDSAKRPVPGARLPMAQAKRTVLPESGMGTTGTESRGSIVRRRTI